MSNAKTYNIHGTWIDEPFHQIGEAEMVMLDDYQTVVSERDALRAALKKYGEHSFSCASEYDQCSCGLSEALRGTERPVVAVREVRDESK